MLAEFVRLGLDYRDLPGLAIGDSAEDAAAFLKHVRDLKPGATWHDVFPMEQVQLAPSEAETCPNTYSPFGPYDYQELPVGAAVLVGWAPGTDPTCLSTFVDRSRAAGFAIYGAGFWSPDGAPEDIRDAMIIFDRAAGPGAADEFWAWVDAQGDMALYWFARTGGESYVATC